MDPKTAKTGEMAKLKVSCRVPFFWTKLAWSDRMLQEGHFVWFRINFEIFWGESIFFRSKQPKSLFGPKMEIWHQLGVKAAQSENRGTQGYFLGIGQFGATDPSFPKHSLNPSSRTSQVISLKGSSWMAHPLETVFFPLDPLTCPHKDHPASRGKKNCSHFSPA